MYKLSWMNILEKVPVYMTVESFHGVSASVYSQLSHWGRYKWPLFSRRHCICISLNENVWILTKTSLTFLPKDPINDIPALLQIMAWRRLGDEPLSKPMLVRLRTHVSVTLPQWVNTRETELNDAEANMYGIKKPNSYPYLCIQVFPRILRTQTISWPMQDGWYVPREHFACQWQRLAIVV